MIAFDGFLRVMALLAGVILLLLMVFTTMDVVMRYFFNSPFRGSLEATEFSMALIVFLGIAYCGWVGGHIGVELFEKFLERPSLRFVPVLVNLAGAALFAVIAWQMVEETRHAWTQISNMLRMPHWPFRMVVAFGSALYAIVLLIHAIRAARGVHLKTSEV
ncbi:MAG: TRAP transporter small permease [Beijerinckiaceae bacterium]|nr:TRAP transporter small permease [Beijerinckiaceae bacterium]